MKKRNRDTRTDRVYGSADLHSLTGIADIISALRRDDLSDSDRAELRDRLYDCADKEELAAVITDTVVDDLLRSSDPGVSEKPTEVQLRIFGALTRRIKDAGKPAMAPTRMKRSLPLGRRVTWRVAAVMIPFIAVAGAYFAGWFGGGTADVPVVVATSNVTVEAIEGVQKDVFLSDSSHIWVNSDSRITYPEQFAETCREVYLEGEAYFDVCRDEAKPFIVHTSKLDVRVLGTEFDVAENLKSETTLVKLHTGSVEVTDGKLSEILKPGQQLTYYHATGKMVVVSAVKTDDWRTEKIFVKNRKLPELFRMIGNYYDVEIVFDEIQFADSEDYDSAFGKHQAAEDVISTLSLLSGQFVCREVDKKIIIEKNRDTN